MRIILLVLFIVSSVALADDYQIFESLDSELEVEPSRYTQYLDSNTNQENLCTGNSTTEVNKNPMSPVVTRDISRAEVYGISCGEKTIITNVFKDNIKVLGESEILISTNKYQNLFKKFHAEWVGDNDYFTLRINTAKKTNFDKYKTNILRVIKSKTVLNEIELYEEFDSFFNFSRDAQHCKELKEEYKKEKESCESETKYLYDKENLVKQNNLDIEVTEYYQEPIKFRLKVDSEFIDSDIEVHSGTATVIVDSTIALNNRVYGNRFIKFELTCLNCANQENITQEFLMNKYFEKKVLDDGGGWEEGKPIESDPSSIPQLQDDWKARDEEYQKNNLDNWNNEIEMRKQKLKERTEENLREAPIKGLNEELKKKKIDDAKKQCKDIGYKPNSDKFRDCILELM